MAKNTTAQRLRADIDQGKTADKVVGPDPAAAPLGTDAEAGGKPVTPAQARVAERQEIADPAQPRRGSLGGRWPILLFAMLALLVLVAIWFGVGLLR